MTHEQADALAGLVRQAATVLKRAVDDLARIAESAVRLAATSERSEEITPRPVEPERCLLSTREIAERLGVSEVSIYRLRKEGMPKYRVGNRVLFDLEKVMDWVEQRNHGSGRRR